MDYEKLFAAKKAGKIEKDMVLIMDNDSGCWHCNNYLLSEEDREKKQDQYKKTYGTPGGYRDIVEVLNAAGIECEWC
jgi:hypothetical protein